MSYGKVNKTTGERIPYAGNASSGTSNYSDLTNKPSINSVTLSGNKTAADLSLAAAYETITYAQWQAMTPAQQAAKDYYISNYPSSQIIAGNVSYSNTSSGMSANNVQGAVDELASEKKDEYTPITYAQWSALTPTQKAAKDYYISDYPASVITAGNVSYNNSSSGMSANNVQSAVDELKSGLTNLNTITEESIGNILFDKAGKVVMAIMVNGTVTTDAEGFVLIDGVKASIPVAYRPKYGVNIVEAYAKKRITIGYDGSINLPNDTSATGLVIRFETTYLTN